MAGIPLDFWSRPRQAVSPLAEQQHNIDPDTVSTIESGNDPSKSQARGRTRHTSMSHRRRQSSMTSSDAIIMLRTSPSVPTATATRTLDASPLIGPESSIDILRSQTHETTSHEPPTVLPSQPLPNHHLDPAEGHAKKADDEDDADTVVKTRLAGFTFGSKAGSDQPVQSAHISRRSKSMRSRPSSLIHSPVTSISLSRPNTILSEPSRPPSLLLTRPAQSSGQSLGDDSTPSPPPTITTTRARKHSHTRSNSISLPNLKMGRPASLGLSPVLSFPSSPVSPDENTPPSTSRVTTGRRLKFEPSGRGAEADKQKEESRRRALEKLTGVTPNEDQPRGSRFNEDGISHDVIALPLDDEMTGTAPFDQLVSAGHPEEPDANHPFLPFTPCNQTGPSPSSSSSTIEPPTPMRPWSFGRTSPGFRDETLGIDAGSASKRISVNSALGVLAEEDENEAERDIDTETAKEQLAGVGPTPTRLRQLHLLPSPASSTPVRTASTPQHMDFSADTGASPTPSTVTSNTLVRTRPSPLHHARTSESDDGQDRSGLSPIGSRGVVPAPSSHRRRQSRGSLSYKRDSTTHDDHRSSGTASEADVLTPLPSSLVLPLRPHASAHGWSTDSSLSHSQIVSSTAPPRWSAPIPAASSASSPHSLRRDDSISLDWHGTSLDMAMQRDALQEDLDMWRARCLAAEGKLDAERKERAMLQSHIRKRTSISSSGREPC